MKRQPSYNFLHFTRKEKNGTVFLLAIILLLAITPTFYPLIFKEKAISESEFKNELARLKISITDSSKKTHNRFFDEDQPGKNIRGKEIKNYHGHGSLFYFDPNTLSADEWSKLGLNENTITTIQNYLSKGGRFREAKDIKKIWGLHREQAEQLLPFVRIEQAITATHNRFPAYENKVYHAKPIAPVDVNNADSTTYVSLPGIGPGYAKRIIKFREKLGGFYKIEQVAETFGLPDSTFQKIKGYLKISGDNTRKININTASLDELKEHPYIRYQLANAIVQFRLQHGSFSSVGDVKKIMLVTDDVFNKISPYLITQ